MKRTSSRSACKCISLYETQTFAHTYLSKMTINFFLILYEFFHNFKYHMSGCHDAGAGLYFYGWCESYWPLLYHVMLLCALICSCFCHLVA